MSADAMRWCGDTEQCVGRGSTSHQVVAWVSANGGEARYDPGSFPQYGEFEPCPPSIEVRARTGWERCSAGQWVVKGEWFVTNPSAPIVQRDRLREFTVRAA